MTTHPSAYVVIHLVAQEGLKDLIGPQVMDHMAVQSETAGAAAPERVIVGFLEPARHAFTRRMRSRLRAYRRRASNVRVVLLPYVSRLSRSANAHVLAARLRRLAGDRPIVFHCRTESAADWAIEFKRYVGRSGVILDVRGAWPEELLFARGFDGPDLAPAELQDQFRAARARLSRAIAGSTAVFTVSRRLVEYLQDVGANSDQLTYVPCCVRHTTFSARERASIRTQLGLDGKLVFAYAGTVTRYQHIEDGLLAFFRLAAVRTSDAHLLCLTADMKQMMASLGRARVPLARVTLQNVEQRDVPGILSAADAGILLRGPSRLNCFSQPTKFAEYLSAGVPVIVGRGTGILDTLVEAHGAGIAVDWFGADADKRTALVDCICDRLRRFGDPMRLAALDLCEREFVWSRYVTTVRAAYRRAIAS